MQIESGSVVIALSTYEKSKGYINKALENLEELKKARAKHFHDIDYNKKEIEDKTPLEKDYSSLYLNPLKYHIFGSYDFAFIMLTENISLTNKVFLPTRIASDEKLNSLKTSVLSGIPIQCENNNIEQVFNSVLTNKNNDYPFVSISNLKLSNTILLGNGYHFIEKVRAKIEFILGDNDNIKYILVDSFASFELTLIIFSNEIEKEKLLEIRSLNVKALYNDKSDTVDLEQLLNNSLLSLDENKIDTEKNGQLHVFADTQSFYGVRLIEVPMPENSEGEKPPIFDWAIKEKEEFKTRIEWEIKPGHEYYVYNILKNIVDKKGNKKKRKEKKVKPYFIHGHTDFDFNLNSTNLSINWEIYDELRNDETNRKIKDGDAKNISKHIRKLTTKIFLDASDHCKKEPPPLSLFNSSDKITVNMVMSLKDINKIREQLKVLKISRELRNRIIKLFYNYNSAIQNPITYNLFIDLHFFIKDLQYRIEEWHNNIIKFLNGDLSVKTISVDYIVRRINNYLSNFEEAFNLRYINNYSFEAVNDFQINYNSPIQELISGFDNYFKALFSFVENNENDISARRLITRANEIRTTTDFTSVNFSIYNLYEPGILFYCATKEIYNFLFKKNDKYNNIYIKNNDIFKTYCDEYFKDKPNSKAIYLQSSLKVYDLEYLVTDFLRFACFFKFDFKFITFWHIAFIAQLPSSYETSGTFNDEQIFKEMFRLLFLAIFSDYAVQIEGNKKVKIKTKFSTERNDPGLNEQFLESCCPLPELRATWTKYFQDLRDFMHDLITSDFNQFQKAAKIEDPKNATTFFDSFIDIYENVVQKDEDVVQKDEDDILKGNIIEILPIPIEEGFSNIFNKEGFNFMDYISIANCKPGELKNFVYSLTYTYLRHVYNISTQENFSVPYLRRNWKTGKPITDKGSNGAKIINGNDKNYFAFDSTGSAFFYEFKKAKEFSKYRNRTFLTLIHVSHILKKIIIQQVISDNKKLKNKNKTND